MVRPGDGLVVIIGRVDDETPRFRSDVHLHKHNTTQVSAEHKHNRSGVRREQNGSDAEPEVTWYLCVWRRGGGRGKDRRLAVPTAGSRASKESVWPAHVQRVCDGINGIDRHWLAGWLLTTLTLVVRLVVNLLESMFAQLIQVT